MSGILQPGKVPRCSRWKYLRNGFLVHRRNRIITEEEIAAHVFSIPLARTLCPLMILRCMIHHKIHTDINIFLMACICQIFQIFHCSEFFLYFTEIGNCITTIRAFRHCIQKRHQMNIVHVALLNIIQFFLNAFHISSKIVNIKHHTHHIILLVPVRMRFALHIQAFQCILSFLIKAMHIVAKFCKHGIISIKFHVKPTKFIMMSL